MPGEGSNVDTSIRMSNSRPELFVYDKRMQEVTLIEEGTTDQNKLHTDLVRRMSRYGILPNDLELTDSCWVQYCLCSHMD